MLRSGTSLITWALLSLAIIIGGSQAQTFFAQPQSHLGRLVQSITSPLVLSAASGYSGDPSDESEQAPASASSGVEQSGSGQQVDGSRPYYQHYRQASYGQQYEPQAHSHAPGSLDQAPSQQRGVPQRYSYSSAAGQSSAPGPAGYNYNYNSNSNSNSNNDDDDEGGLAALPRAPSSSYRPSRAEQTRASRPHQEYQMGAYLGPSIDDKEIQGAFNSNGDEDDGPAGYVGPPGHQRSSAAGSDARPMQNMGSHFGSGGPPGMPAASSARHPSDPYAFNSDDAGESSQADEDGDDGPAPARPNSASQLNQAASQYHRQRQPRARTGQQLAMAANGYAPYGPIDLSGLMAAANAGQAPAGYEVYSGDGGYPMGPFAGPAGGNSRRQQAASMANQFGYGPNYGPQQGSQRGGNDDDADADADED